MISLRNVTLNAKPKEIKHFQLVFSPKLPESCPFFGFDGLTLSSLNAAAAFQAFYGVLAQSIPLYDHFPVKAKLAACQVNHTDKEMFFGKMTIFKEKKLELSLPDAEGVKYYGFIRKLGEQEDVSDKSTVSE